MVARRSDNRRRRIFVESGSRETSIETSNSRDEPAQAIGTGKAKVLYAAGADRRHQPKTTDLIPKRVWSVVALVSGLLLIVIGLNFIAFYSPTWEPTLGSESIDSLRLTGRGTIAAWFSSMLFIVSGLASLQIYALRQHRRDDYRGSFRIWLWMSALLLLASANCVVDLGSIGTRAVQHWLSSSASPTVGIYWVFTIKMVLMSLLIARGIFEIRESRGTLAIVTLVWVAYLSASILQLPNTFNAINQLTVRQQEIMTGNLQVLVVVGLFLAHLLFARFIYLQATGLIKPKEKKKVIAKPKKKPASKLRAKSKSLQSAQGASDVTADQHVASTMEQDPGWEAEQEPKPEKKIRAQATSSEKAPVQIASDSVPSLQEPDENEPILSMSKAERRRQRKSSKGTRRAA